MLISKLNDDLIERLNNPLKLIEKTLNHDFKNFHKQTVQYKY